MRGEGMTYMLCSKSMQRCPTPGMCAPHGGCQPEKGFEYGHLDPGKFIDCVYALKTERDQLKAENKGLRRDALELRAQIIYSGWSDQDGFVPWVVRGNSLKQDEARSLAREAMAKEQQP